jgi:GNAT superfamily N-acetyltransferase
MRDTGFDLGNVVLRPLRLADRAAIQQLGELCNDYSRMLEDTDTQPGFADEILRDVDPPLAREWRELGWLGTAADGSPVALLMARDGYPHDDIAFVGLLLLVPDARGARLGERIVEAFAEAARASGSRRMRVAVLQENRRALRFWSRVGFRTVGPREPRVFGNKTHMRIEMERWLVARPAYDPLDRFLDGEGRLTQYPLDPALRLRALARLADPFEAGRRYSETEVNEILKRHHTFGDWAWMRRELCDRRFLERTSDCRSYWRASAEAQVADSR